MAGLGSGAKPLRERAPRGRRLRYNARMNDRPIELGVVRAEIEGLHQFLTEWITGACPADSALLRTHLAERLVASFRYVMPGGVVLQGAQATTDMIRGLHGTNAALRLSIANVTLHYADERAVLASYEEQQRGARHLQPADHVRLSSVLLVRGGERLLWHHLQETLKPPAADGPRP